LSLTIIRKENEKRGGTVDYSHLKPLWWCDTRA